MGLTGKKPIARIIFSSLSRVLPETGILFVVQGARAPEKRCVLVAARSFSGPLQIAGGRTPFFDRHHLTTSHPAYDELGGE
jgi:hypothetical protein